MGGSSKGHLFVVATATPSAGTVHLAVTVNHVDRRCSRRHPSSVALALHPCRQGEEVERVHWIAMKRDTAHVLAVAAMPISASIPSTLPRMSSRIRRTTSSGCPAGSSTTQSM